jgi:hypothetical protein
MSPWESGETPRGVGQKGAKMEATNETKWVADNLGPRQAKAFNQAISKFNWEAKTITEITDHGTSSVTPMFTGPVNPGAAPALLAIKAKYNATVTGANYSAIVAEIQAATAKLSETRPVEDRRTTAEERAERARIVAEGDAKRAAVSAHKATLKRHEYGLAETSRAVKQVLSTLFPGTTFSVRSDSYSMGNSIDASWKDGPTEKQVTPILNVFQRSWFDGMDDSTHHIPEQEWNGHLFDFTGQSTRGSRGNSAALLAECRERFIRETGADAPAIAGVETGHPYIPNAAEPCGWNFFVHQPDEYPNGVLCRDECGYHSADNIIHQMAHFTGKEASSIEYVTEWAEGEPEPANSLRAVVFGILLGLHKPAGTPAAPSTGVSHGGVTVSENDAKDGIEIRFGAKPAAEVLERLKGAGWRWSRFGKCWYARRTAAARAFAEGIAGGTVAPAAGGEDYPCSDAGYEDACARACEY